MGSDLEDKREDYRSCSVLCCVLQSKHYEKWLHKHSFI